MFDYNRYDKFIGHTERKINESDLIVSKTDLKGIITYANPTFIAISGYRTDELIGKNHNIIRHPDMPQTIYAYLWSQLAEGKNLYAYVKNLAKDGSFYWAFSYFVPDYDENGKVVGYHSERRAPNFKAIDEIVLLYKQLKNIEIRDGIEDALAFLHKAIAKHEESYESYIFTLQNKF